MKKFWNSGTPIYILQIVFAEKRNKLILTCFLMSITIIYLVYDSNWSLAPHNIDKTVNAISSVSTLSGLTQGDYSPSAIYNRYIWYQIKNVFELGDTQKNHGKIDNSINHNKTNSLSKIFEKTNNANFTGIKEKQQQSLMEQILPPFLRLFPASPYSIHKNKAEEDINCNKYRNQKSFMDPENIDNICFVYGQPVNISAIKRNYQLLNYIYSRNNSSDHAKFGPKLLQSISLDYPVINLPTFRYLINVRYPECDKDTKLLSLRNKYFRHKQNNNEISLRRKAAIPQTLTNSVDKRLKKDLIEDITAADKMNDNNEYNDNKRLNLVVLIHSAPKNFLQRKMIRQTWGSVKYLGHQKTAPSFKYPSLESLSLENENIAKSHTLRSLFKILIGNMTFMDMNVRLVFLTARMLIEGEEYVPDVKSYRSTTEPYSPLFQAIRRGQRINLNYYGRGNNTINTSDSILANVSTTRLPATFNYKVYQNDESINKMNQRLLETESLQYGDIVQGDFIDSYKNLTYKMIMGFKWITEQCPHADYVLKMDDDIFVEIFTVFTILNKYKAMSQLYTNLVKNQQTCEEFTRITPKNMRDVIEQAKIFTANNMNIQNTKDGIIRGFTPEDGEWVDDSTQPFLYVAAQHFTRNRTFYGCLSDKYPVEKPTMASKNNTSVEMGINKTTCDTCKLINKTITSYYGRKAAKNHLYELPSPSPDIHNGYHQTGKDTIPQDYMEQVILCNVWVGMPVLRDVGSKWYVSKDEYQADFYTPYCSGWALLITGSAATKIFLQAPRLPYFWIDDAHVTGTIANYSGVVLRRLNSRFSFDSFRSNYAWTTATPNQKKLPHYVGFQNNQAIIISNANTNTTMNGTHTTSIPSKQIITQQPSLNKIMFSTFYSNDLGVLAVQWNSLLKFYQTHFLLL